MKEAIQLVGQELRWAVENRGMSTKGEDYESAFIDGIVHIHNVLIRAHSHSPRPCDIHHFVTMAVTECEKCGLRISHTGD